MATKEKKRVAVKSIHQKELFQIRELCGLLKQLSCLHQTHLQNRRAIDSDSLVSLTLESKKSDELMILGVETTMSVINISLRKQSLLKSLFSRIRDERDVNALMQSHRDEFTSFVWQRRSQTKKHVSELFQGGPGIMGRFGEMISEATKDSLAAFEKSNSGRICDEAITSGLVESEDVQGYFGVVQLLNYPRNDIKIHSNRLEFSINPAITDNSWHTVFTTTGPCAIKYFAKPLVRSLIEETLNSLHNMTGREGDFVYVPILARLVDLVHPTYQLQASVLAYPLFGAQILKRRVAALGYDTPQSDDTPVDYKYTMELVRHLQRKLEQDLRVYYEFTVPCRTEWIVGVTTAGKVSIRNMSGYPGKEHGSFGFTSMGTVFADGIEKKYIDVPEKAAEGNTRYVGVLVDLYNGTLQLVCDGTIHHAGFGKGAAMWSEQEQHTQTLFLTKQQMIPTFSLKATSNESVLSKPRMQVNFGTRAFHYFVNATALCYMNPITVSKEKDSGTILEPPSTHRERVSQEEDEKMNMSLEKNYFRVSLLPEAAKSFSQFPPSVYRRSLAATRIQRTWRRYQGRKMRQKIKKDQYRAACIIQRMARRKLRKIREVKNQAAHKIQKAWRIKCHIRIALLRCIYRQPISTLQNAAIAIQRKWRDWHMFRNSPLASKYHRRIEGTFNLLDLEKAVNTIISWWRPLYIQLREIRERRIKTGAVIRIQAMYRGFRLRSQLRNDIKEKLRNLGETMLKSKKSLQALTAAYKIQRAWKNYVKKRIRKEKVKTRHLAATKIQAVWKGYWVRSLTTIRFSYGEVVFLMAVRKSLQNCHFILKTYKPCGIVCPKPDRRR